VGSVWTQYSKQVTAHSAFLTPRDVATIIHAYARIKFKDEKLLVGILPVVVKHMNEFSVRELVAILGAFRKLEVSTQKIDCIHLIVSQLVLKKTQWTVLDTPLIANAISWFRMDDFAVWKSVERMTLRDISEMAPLGHSLTVGALARMDIRNERMLRAIATQFMQGDAKNIMKQESLAVLINGFAKLDWNQNGLFEYIENELGELLQGECDPSAFFDSQSACLILHALVALRFEHVDLESSQTVQIVSRLVQQLHNSLEASSWKPSSDQLEKLSAVKTVLKGRDFSSPTVFRNLSLILREHPKKHFRKPKLPRWEYEVFRIMKTKMMADVRKEYHGGRVDVVLKNRKTLKSCPLVIVSCLGPFQHYANSTKRTAVSRLNCELLRIEKAAKFIEIPYYIWNELKTDQDKIMYLMSKGREVLDDDPVVDSDS
jgi:hypothetical protein